MPLDRISGIDRSIAERARKAWDDTEAEREATRAKIADWPRARCRDRAAAGEIRRAPRKEPGQHLARRHRPGWPRSSARRGRGARRRRARAQGAHLRAGDRRGRGVPLRHVHLARRARSSLGGADRRLAAEAGRFRHRLPGGAGRADDQQPCAAKRGGGCRVGGAVPLRARHGQCSSSSRWSSGSSRTGSS